MARREGEARRRGGSMLEGRSSSPLVARPPDAAARQRRRCEMWPGRLQGAQRRRRRDSRGGQRDTRPLPAREHTVSLSAVAGGREPSPEPGRDSPAAGGVLRRRGLGEALTWRTRERSGVVSEKGREVRPGRRVHTPFKTLQVSNIHSAGPAARRPICPPPPHLPSRAVK